MEMFRVGVDASNIRAGGGVTHLVECLGVCNPLEHGVDRVIVYGGPSTLGQIADRPWLEKRVPNALRHGAIERFWWRQWRVTREVSRTADLLLIPGGSYLGSFRPFVALAQNLLPFDDHERRREGLTLKRLRLRLLETIQSRTFRVADGVVFMTEISRSMIERRMNFRPRHSRVIYHGVSRRFIEIHQSFRQRVDFTETSPFRLLYVSILESYKHQDKVVEAVAALRAGGLPVRLDLVGPGARADQSAVRQLMERHDPARTFLRYRGSVAYDKLNKFYQDADAFVFASSCETFGLILLEAMAAGLPIACSHRSALPEVAGDATINFDPLSVRSIADVITRMLTDGALRRSLSFQGRERAGLFSWEKCASDTFGFLREVYDRHQQGQVNTV